MTERYDMSNSAADIGTDGRPVVLFVCTGNAARSVMAAAMLRETCDAVEVISAGTHSIPGLPMSVRTRAALDAYGLSDLAHRSAQLDADSAARASLIAVFEPMHIQWIRRELPEAAARAASLPRLARDLDAGPGGQLQARVEALSLASCEWEPWEEIVDPAGGEVPDFLEAAAVIDAAIRDLAPRLV